MNEKSELYYIVKIKFNSKTNYAFEMTLPTHDKAIAVQEAKKLKSHAEIISIKLMERLWGYEDRLIYEFERE